MGKKKSDLSIKLTLSQTLNLGGSLGAGTTCQDSKIWKHHEDIYHFSSTNHNKNTSSFFRRELILCLSQVDQLCLLLFFH